MKNSIRFLVSGAVLALVAQAYALDVKTICRRMSDHADYDRANQCLKIVADGKFDPAVYEWCDYVDKGGDSTRANACLETIKNKRYGDPGALKICSDMLKSGDFSRGVDCLAGAGVPIEVHAINEAEKQRMAAAAARIRAHFPKLVSDKDTLDDVSAQLSVIEGIANQ